MRTTFAPFFAPTTFAFRNGASLWSLWRRVCIAQQESLPCRQSHSTKADTEAQRDVCSTDHTATVTSRRDGYGRAPVITLIVDALLPSADFENLYLRVSQFRHDYVISSQRTPALVLKFGRAGDFVVEF